MTKYIILLIQFSTKHGKLQNYLLLIVRQCAICIQNLPATKKFYCVVELTLFHTSASLKPQYRIGLILTVTPFERIYSNAIPNMHKSQQIGIETDRISHSAKKGSRIHLQFKTH